jgi:hypothetical protein
MANTIASGLQNNIIAQSALDAFVDILAPLASFSQSFNDQAAETGATINVTTLANTSGATDFAGTYTAMDTTYATTTITLDNHKFNTWHLSDTEYSESSAVELERFGYQKGGELAKLVFEDILSAVTVANFSSATIIAATSFDVDDVADLRQAMISIGAMPDLCNIVVGPAYFANLLKDSKIVADAYGSREAIRDGQVPSLFGFNGIYESGAIPDNSENLGGFVCHPSAMAVAMRYLEPSDSSQYISTRRLTDARSGIVLGYREYYTASTGKKTAVLEAVYGYTAAIGADLQRITTS